MRGFCAIGLDNPKSSINVGSVFRAAGCYGAKLVVVSGQRPRRYLSKIPTDTQRAWRTLPVITADDLRNAIPLGCVPVAVDLVDGAYPLTNYVHPQQAFYIFGAEDATLGERITRWCRDVIYVPTNGCMNLAATVNVVLYDRLSKQQESGFRLFSRRIRAA